MSETPRGKYPNLIQRLFSRSKNNQVRLAERYHFDAMKSEEFDYDMGILGQTIGSMFNHLELGTFEIDGIQISAIWTRQIYNFEGVQHALEMLFREQVPTAERHEFTAAEYQHQQALEKNRTEKRKQYLINAWIDIETGLFWTWEKIHLPDILLNFTKTIEWNKLTYEEQRGVQVHAPQGRAYLGSKLAEAFRKGKTS